MAMATAMATHTDMIWSGNKVGRRRRVVCLMRRHPLRGPCWEMGWTLGGAGRHKHDKPRPSCGICGRCDVPGTPGKAPGGLNPRPGAGICTSSGASKRNCGNCTTLACLAGMARIGECDAPGRPEHWPWPPAPCHLAASLAPAVHPPIRPSLPVWNPALPHSLPAKPRPTPVQSF